MAKKKKIMPKKFKLFFYSFWVIFFSGITIFSGIFYAASMGYLGEMPDFRQLENPNTNLATQIISSDNKVLGKFHFGENRIPIQFDDLPKSLVDALIATEDERFYGHSGIDFKGTLRAIVFLGQRGGASTISQQLARQLFVGVRAKNIFQALAQKFKEYVIAVRLERQYTKHEIVAMYLNIYDFGYNGDGIKSAANIFFDKELDSLKIEESAVLVGMLKNSSYYNPLRRPELVKNRRNVVLNQMKRNGHLNQQAVDSLKQTTLGINYTPQSHREGLATYFRAYLRNFMKNWSSENLKSDGWKPLLEKENMIGMQRGNQQITTEPGLQCELSGAPLENIHQVCSESSKFLKEIEAASKGLNINTVSIGFDPFNNLSEVPQNPKTRYKIMTKEMPKGGKQSLDMMYRTCGIQINYDYTSESNFEKIFRLAELKSQIKNLKSLDCTAGKYNEGGRWGNSESVIRHSEITVTERDLIIKDLEAQIEHIQEELDTHNHNTEI